MYKRQHQNIHGKRVNYPEYKLSTLQNIVYIEKENAVLATFIDITKEEAQAREDYERKLETLSLIHILPRLTPEAFQQEQEQLFKDSADNDDHKGPGEESCGIQVQLGVIELFPDGTVRNTDDLRRCV